MHKFTIEEIKILKDFCFELDKEDIYKIPNENNYDYLMKMDNHYFIESFYFDYEDDDRWYEDMDTWFSTIGQPLKEFLIDIYGIEVLTKLRQNKIERICGTNI